MDNVSTMNLSDSDSGGMTPLFPSARAPSQQPQPPERQQNDQLVYQPNVPIEKSEKNNIGKSKAMDSTPLSDIMMPGEEYMSQPAGGGPDPRFMMAPQPSYVQQQMPTPSMYQSQQQQPTKAATSSKNPLNLTDEQVEALLAGVVALAAFSDFAQEKMSALPKFLDEAGKRSTIGSIITALVVAVLFYFSRRFLIKA